MHYPELIPETVQSTSHSMKRDSVGCGGIRRGQKNKADLARRATGDYNGRCRCSVKSDSDRKAVWRCVMD